MSYPLEFRIHVLKIQKKEKLSFSKASERFGIAVNTLFLWSKNLSPKGTRNKPATKVDMNALKEDIQSYPDAYQYERAQRLGVSQTCIFFALKRLKVSYKKNSQTSQGRSRKAVYFLPDDPKL